MRLIIDYKNVENKLVRTKLQVISMTGNDLKNERIFIIKDNESEGTYFTLKNMVSLDIIRD